MTIRKNQFVSKYTIEVWREELREMITDYGWYIKMIAEDMCKRRDYDSWKAHEANKLNRYKAMCEAYGVPQYYTELLEEVRKYY
jgi:hypothetical protein